MSYLKRMTTTLKNENIFPSDVTRIPMITIKGNDQFIIENEYVLHEFSSDKVVLQYEKGKIEIIGLDLKIKMMVKEEIILQGIIISIEFI